MRRVPFVVCLVCVRACPGCVPPAARVLRCRFPRGCGRDAKKAGGGGTTGRGGTLPPPAARGATFEWAERVLRTVRTQVAATASHSASADGVLRCAYKLLRACLRRRGRWCVPRGDGNRGREGDVTPAG
ncbi:hypothetical protein EON67_04425, partial [archaeon]